MEYGLIIGKGGVLIILSQLMGPGKVLSVFFFKQQG